MNYDDEKYRLAPAHRTSALASSASVTGGNWLVSRPDGQIRVRRLFARFPAATLPSSRSRSAADGNGTPYVRWPSLFLLCLALARDRDRDASAGPREREREHARSVQGETRATGGHFLHLAHAKGLRASGVPSGRVCVESASELSSNRPAPSWRRPITMIARSGRIRFAREISFWPNSSRAADSCCEPASRSANSRTQLARPVWRRWRVRSVY